MTQPARQFCRTIVTVLSRVCIFSGSETLAHMLAGQAQHSKQTIYNITTNLTNNSSITHNYITRIQARRKDSKTLAGQAQIFCCSESDLSLSLSLSLSIYLSIYLSLSLYIYIYIHVCYTYIYIYIYIFIHKHINTTNKVLAGQAQIFSCSDYYYHYYYYEDVYVYDR